MPFTALVVVVAIVVGYARGGRLSRIADADLGWSWLLFIGLALQLAVDFAAARESLVDPWGTVGLVASQLLVLGWVAANRFRPGMPLVLLGLLLNATVIVANGAMPVDPEAIAAIGLPGAEPLPGKHELMTGSTRLPWLGDIFPLPPLRTVISVGDVVLAAGLIPLLNHLMHYRSAVERRGGQRGSVPTGARGERDGAAAD